MAAIVEGYGDVQAVPALIGKTAQHFGTTAVAPQPIRAGEWKSLRRPGELENYLELAASRGWDLILIVLDLDDDCAAEESQVALSRIEAWKNGRTLEVALTFIVKEYESLFLASPSCLGTTTPPAIQNPETVRAAKHAVKVAIGRKYKETQDQLRFTQALDLSALFDASRSYRKFCKSLTGLGYDVLTHL